MIGRTAAALLPALLFAALHLRTLDYGFVWVDRAEIVDGRVLRPPGRILAAFGEPLQATPDFATRGFAQPYYRPLQVVVASALDARFGREPRTFRSASLLLGAATASLFSLLALRLLRDPAAALLAGLAFAAHPALLEIYVWISGLSAALMGFFLIACALCGLRALHAAAPGRGVAWGAASLVLLALALLSKENATVAPALVLALGLAALNDPRDAAPTSDVAPPHDEAPPRDMALSRARGARLSALFAAQALLVAVYLFVLRPAVLGSAIPGAPPIGGNLATQWQTSLATWPAQLAWLFVPLRASTSDAVRLATGWTDPATLAGLALAAGSAVVCIAWLRRRHVLAAAALAWIWIAFLPASGLVPLLHARAERNLFVPLFGAALLAGCAFEALRRRPGRAPRALALWLALLFVGGLAARSATRTPAWRSTESLFAQDVARDPRHREGRINLALAYLESGRIELARREAAVLAAQDPAREGWHSYAFEPSLRELVCVVNRAAGAEADTLRRYPILPRTPSEVWSAPGFHACLAQSLERLGRCEQALPIYTALSLGAGGAEGQAFAEGVSRCVTALGRPGNAPRRQVRPQARGEAP